MKKKLVHAAESMSLIAVCSTPIAKNFLSRSDGFCFAAPRRRKLYEPAAEFPYANFPNDAFSMRARGNEGWGRKLRRPNPLASDVSLFSSPHSHRLNFPRFYSRLPAFAVSWRQPGMRPNKTPGQVNAGTRKHARAR